MSADFAPPPAFLGLYPGKRLRFIGQPDAVNPPIPTGTFGVFVKQVYYGKWWCVRFDDMPHPHHVYPFEMEMIDEPSC